MSENKLKELLEKANKCYGEKNYAEAVELYREAAEKGDAEALYMLGICYNYKTGVEETDEEKCAVTASGYFFKAAELGHAQAQCFAALCCLHGIGVEKDTDKAVERFKKSAEQNCTQAMNNLGLLCENGIGVADSEKRYEESFAWFKKSADLKDPTGQLYVGKAYYAGQGVKRDYGEAVNWYTLAAEQGSADALFRLGECYDDGEGVAQSAIKAFGLYKKAAQLNHPKAQCYVGIVMKRVAEWRATWKRR